MPELDELAVARLSQLLGSGLVTHALSAAAALGVADALATGPASSGDVAERCGGQPAAVLRLLRALGSLDVVEEVDADWFDLTDLGHLLRTDHPSSLRSWAVVQSRLMTPLWSGLSDALRAGKPAAELVFGRPFYEHLAAQPELDDLWNQSMVETARAWLDREGLLDLVDWSAVRSVVDVGGGHGGLLALLLGRYPHLRGVLCDLPSVVAGAGPVLAAAGVDKRVEVVAGDFLERVPPGADVSLLARVVFNWDDEPAVRLLRACREAMGEGGRLLVIDHLLPDDDTRHPARLNDLSLLAIGGRARRWDEWEALITAGGLRATARPPYGGQVWQGLLLERAG